MNPAVNRSYTVIVAPVLEVASPGNGSLGALSGGQQTVAVRVTFSAQMGIQYEIEEISTSAPISESIQPNSDQSVAVPAQLSAQQPVLRRPCFAQLTMLSHPWLWPFCIR
jgi:hypothetical protein